MPNFNRNEWTKHLTKNGSKCLQNEKPSKFKSKKVLIDGIEFDSKKEGERYLQLKMLERGGVISKLKWQVSFDLRIRRFEVNGELVDIGYLFMREYIADFTYYDRDGKFIVEDVKSDATRKLRPYKMKKRLMKLIYKIEIVEV